MVQFAEANAKGKLLLRKQHWMGVDRSFSRTIPSLRYRGNYVGLRYDGGMLVYATCSRTELLRFALNRKLSPPAKASEQLIEFLEDNETFPRFLDLPAELRSFIYEHYFEFNPHKYNGLRVPPPVTEVNRMLRAEALPQFWADRRFPIQMDAWLRQGQLIFDFYEDGRRFFGLATNEQIGMIKRLHIRFLYYNSEWELDLARGEKPPAVRRVKGCEDTFDEPLLEFIKSISKRDGSSLLSARDGLDLKNLLIDLAKARLGE